ncbi:hypothetical protein [Chryseobacterium chendengshani]|uniref:hypothetical protein n=1 Tax=unclassified Chryseobacterium TaxID=2593645 RepID=UPI001C64367B|nr:MULTISPECIES: hypothetical protein [unclassified Chryseobacterium]MBW7676326.1 hypothetical protein [Chryseobacterium sp. LJ756]MBW8524063.1 hypothetical protein [Chryseobacterium sp. LJ668]QYK16999.1 hypothetical protein K0U91_02370 [Chryseobacterium sp. LJ668]
MIKKKLIFIFSVFIIFTACRENKSFSKSAVSDGVKDTLISKASSQKDIYINKEFFSGDEMTDVETYKTAKTGIDSLSYSIYKERNTKNYIFSLEKFLKNDDVEKYRITDTLNLKSADVTVTTETVGNNKVLSLKWNQKLLKKWSFETNTIKTSQWIGNFSGSFLRMKEESGDPRSKGMINIQIQKNSAQFQLDSYVENIKKDLIILTEKDNEIVLSEKNNKNSTFIMTKNNKKYFLKSNFINKTVGEDDTYEMIKQ